MSYEMSHQNMAAYPYPPPAGAVAAPPARKTRFSKWWPISFFIAAVLFFIVGGGLVGGWTSSAYNCTSLYSRSSRYSSYSSYSSCNMGMWYGAVACFALGGICKLTAWILLIVWCVKRSSSRSSQPASVAYTYQPLTYAGAPLAPSAAPTYQNVVSPYQQQVPAAPAQSKQSTGMAGVKYCGQCGAGVTTPFCPNCGIQV
ncbi:hypothetical protein C8A01DRAFT_39402 [Parachaetomium inaequale]|uniref:Uncharacterized protein n=1 Tax=Parachaetomium inaequale TaxID=2588326 RepID=A0AAN6P9C8_9PEZI|nr:hypothetical protein C8A01DRAFT_39402 [Parachaetomium inaequale]